jgi:hypothetical protein
MSAIPKIDINAEVLSSHSPKEGFLKNFEDSEEYKQQINKESSNDNFVLLRTGKWFKEEHHRFLSACEKFGSNWVEVKNTKSRFREN